MHSRGTPYIELFQSAKILEKQPYTFCFHVLIFLFDKRHLGYPSATNNLCSIVYSNLHQCVYKLCCCIYTVAYTPDYYFLFAVSSMHLFVITCSNCTINCMHLMDKRMICLSKAITSFKTYFHLSSNYPRNLVPTSNAPMSNDIISLFK